MPRKPGQRDPYERIGVKAARGEFKLIDPLDYLFLQELIDEGTMMGGYYPIGVTAAKLKKEKFSLLTAAQVGSRLRVLQAQGLATPVEIVGGKAWQRTAKGKEILEAWLKTKSGE